MSARPAAGFTLIEVVIALSLVGALLAVTFGGLRVGLAAWRQGDARAEHLQRVRSLTQMLVRAVGGAFPYHGDQTRPQSAPPAFEGERDRLAFVTAQPPVPLAAPIAFTAVAFSQEDGGFTIREGPLPSEEAFKGLTPVLVDPRVGPMRFRYLRGDRTWTERWDMAAEQALPAAVEITVVDQAPLVVPIRVVMP